MGMWRRRWIGLAAAWGVAVVGAVVLLRVPDRYEATARVFVDTQTVLKPLMSGLAVQPNVDEQISMLARTLITRPNLEKNMRSADMDIAANTQAERDRLGALLPAESPPAASPAAPKTHPPANPVTDPTAVHPPTSAR
jgi:uncharacterized protein involved in exopolysaccharide biosynthesis